MCKATVVTFFMVLNSRNALRTEFSTSVHFPGAPDPDVNHDMKGDEEMVSAHGTEVSLVADAVQGPHGDLPIALYGGEEQHRARTGSTPSLDRCTTSESRQICTLQEVLSDPGSQIPEEELSTPPPTPSLRKEQLQEEA